MSEHSTTQPQPLSLPVPIWIGLGLVALLALSRMMSPEGLLSREPRLQQFAMQIERQTEGIWHSDELGIKVDLPDGWIYLEITNAEPTVSTFAHLGSNSIVRLVPNVFETWPPLGSKVNQQQLGKFEIEWIDPVQLRRVVFVTTNDAPIKLDWRTTDPRRIGRIHNQKVDVIIVTLNTDRDVGISEAVREFCNSIEMI